MKFLIVLHAAHNTVGGHSIAVRHLSQCLIDRGHGVDVLVQKQTFLEEILPAAVRRRLIPRWTRTSGYWVIGRIISRLMREHAYDAVISFNRICTFHASIPCAIHGKPLIPVLAGGSARDITYLLRTNILVSFSEEIRQALVTQRNWNQDEIVVCAARHDPRAFLPAEQFTFVPRDIVRIAWISRLHSQKRTAFKYFLAELEDLASQDRDRRIQARVYGDGEDEVVWGNMAARLGCPERIGIAFMGRHQVSGDCLRGHDLIVAQGNGIIEAMLSGVPAAVCGEEGYAGLVTEAHFQRLAATNFTGRGMEHDVRTTLAQDITAIHARPMPARLRNLQRIAAQGFDVTRLAELIEGHAADGMANSRLVPGNGSVMRCVWQNITSIIQSRHSMAGAASRKNHSFREPRRPVRSGKEGQ